MKLWLNNYDIRDLTNEVSACLNTYQNVVVDAVWMLRVRV